jgi:hypothetical protein
VKLIRACAAPKRNKISHVLLNFLKAVDMLTTKSASSVEVINAGSGPFAGNITWDVGSSATLGTTTAFLGTIISKAGDSLDNAATIGCGRVISLGASVTLIHNVITTPGSSGGCAETGGSGGTITAPPPPLPISIPEPGTLALLSSGLLGMVFRMHRKRS